MKYMKKFFEAEGLASGTTQAPQETQQTSTTNETQQTSTTTETQNAVDILTQQTQTPNNTITLLGENATPEEINSFYSKLGRPEEFSKYELTKPEGYEIRPELETWAKENFFKAGLSSKQANELFNAYNELAIKDQKEYAEKSLVEVNELKKSWGDKANFMIENGRDAVAKLGLSKDDLNVIEKASGTTGMLKLLATIGTKINGDKGNLVTSDKGSTNIGMSKETAREEIAKLSNSEEFNKVYRNAQAVGYKDAVTKMRNLYAIAYAE